MDAILRAENIIKSYGREEVLKGISLDIMPGTFTAIVGHSGSGKSTLLNILSGLMGPDGGQVLYKGNPVTGLTERQAADLRRREIGHVFQDCLLLNQLTAEENIRIGIHPRNAHLDLGDLALLLGIEGILGKFPAQLSGGQRQRVAVARAVIKKPEVLFCDEATGSLDEANSKRVVGMLHGLRSSIGMTVLFTTHNRQIARTADRIMTMKDGRIVQDVANEDPIPAGRMEWR